MVRFRLNLGLHNLKFVHKSISAFKLNRFNPIDSVRLIQSNWFDPIDLIEAMWKLQKWICGQICGQKLSKSDQKWPSYMAKKQKKLSFLPHSKNSAKFTLIPLMAEFDKLKNSCYAKLISAEIYGTFLGYQNTQPSVNVNGSVNAPEFTEFPDVHFCGNYRVLAELP